MQVVIKKWGNSASVRIPVGIMEAARLHLDDVVDVSAQDGRIVITPIRTKDYDLNQLLAAITPENLHGEADLARRSVRSFCNGGALRTGSGRYCLAEL